MEFTDIPPGKSTISVIGAGCAVPGAASLDELWQLLVEKKCLIRQEPLNRWAIDPFLRKGPKKSGYAYTFAGGYLDNPFLFDPAPFGLSPREAEQMDPQQRILLETVWRSFENAGLPISKVKGKPVGVYVGASLVDYQSAASHDMHAIGSHFMTGNSLSILANRISYVFNFKGPSATYDAACASSFVALYHAVQALRSREIDYAVVAGVNLMFSPLPFVGFCQAGMLSPSGQSRPFSNHADGYVRAEGCIALLLRRSQDAKHDGHNILTDIIDIQTNSDGRKTGISLPSASGQTALINAIYERNGIDPNDLQFVEAHGTGTPVGDPIEAHAIGTALGHKRSQSLIIGSIKSNLGHLEAASGLAGLLKASLALNHDVYPATVNIDVTNKRIPLDELNLAIASDTVILDPARPALAGVCNYGFGGVNAHVILRRPVPIITNEADTISAGAATPSPVRADMLVDQNPSATFANTTLQREELHPSCKVTQNCDLKNASNPPHFLLLTAASEPALRAMAQQALDWLAAGHRLEELAAILGHGTMPMGFRLVAPLQSNHQLVEALEHFIQTGHALAPLQMTNVDPSQDLKAHRLAFILSGNGAQQINMGQRAYRESPLFREAILRFDAAFKRVAGWSIADKIQSGLSAEDLDDTTIAQPALCAFQIALCDSLRAYGLNPDCVMGHSVGEITAAYAAGIFDLDTIAHLIFHRSLSQHEVKGRGSMAVVAMDGTQLGSLLTEHRLNAIAIAAFNGERSTTISSDYESLKQLELLLKAERIAFVPLAIDYPFHSPALNPFARDFLKNVGTLSLLPEQSQFFSTVRGGLVPTQELNASYWWANIRQPVLFRETLRSVLDAREPTHLVELGPKAILTAAINEQIAKLPKKPIFLPHFNELVHENADPVAHFIASFIINLPSLEIEQRAVSICGQKPAGKMAVPPYPFYYERYVLKTEPYITLYGGVTDNEMAHPLLGRPLRNEGFEWSATLSPNDLAGFEDHCVNGVVVLPAAGFIELCFAALKASFPDQEPYLHSLDILRPATLDHGLTLTTRLDQRTQEISVWGKKAQSLQDQVLYARARYQPFTPQKSILANDRQSVRSIKDHADRLASVASAGIDQGGWASFTKDEVYRRAQERGLEYGPHFQLVTGGRRGQDQGHAELDAPIAKPFLVNPMSVDAGFHSLLLDLGSGDDASETFLPVRFSGIQLCKERTPIRHVRSAVLARRNATSAARLTYYDAAGEIVIGIEQAVFRRTHLAHTTDQQAFSYHWLPLLHGISHVAALSAGDRPVNNLGLAQKSSSRLNRFLDLYRLLLWRILAAELQRDSDTWMGIAPAADNGLIASGRTLLDHSPFALPDHKTATDHGGVSEADLAGAIMAAYPSAATDLQAASSFKVRLQGQQAILDGSSDGVDLEPSAHKVGALVGSLIDNLVSSALVRWINKTASRYNLVIDSRNLAISDGLRTKIITHAQALCTSLHLISNELDWKQHLILSRQSNGSNIKPWAWLTLSNPARRSAADGPKAAEAAMIVEVEWQLDPIITYALQVLEGAPLPLSRAGPSAAQAGRVLRVKNSVGVLTLRRRSSRRVQATSKASSTCLPSQEILSGSLGDAETLLTSWRSQRQEGREPRQIHIDCRAVGKLSLTDKLMSLRSILEAITVETSPPPLVLMTSGGYEPSSEPKPEARAIIGFARVARNEFPRLRIVTLDTDADLEPQSCAHFFDLNEPELFIAKDHTLHVPRLADNAHFKPLGDKPTTLQYSARGGFSGMKWIEDTRPSELTPDEIMVDVTATCLNYRDVLVAMGLLDDDLLGHGYSEGALGFEFFGTISAVGSGVIGLVPGAHVMGFCREGGFRSRLKCRSQDVFFIPPTLAAQGIGGSLVAYVTAYYALVVKAQLRRGEAILIHGGAGAVGFAATQIAKDLGAHVITTARDAERGILSRWAGADDLQPSRNLAFYETLKAQGGVDVVLNSIAGDGMRASMDILRPFGRFVELGKRDFLDDTPLSLRPFLRNLTYFGVDLDELIKHQRPVLADIIRTLVRRFSQRRYAPVPITLYPGAAIGDAFQAMQQSGHFGKLAVQPNTKSLSPALVKDIPLASVPLALGQYIVVGGTRGLGLETALWLAQHGVRHLVLISRTGSISPNDAARLEALAASGVTVTIDAVDIADREALEARFAVWRSSHIPIVGLIHSAVHLEDGVIHNLSAEALSRVFASKVVGARHLDELSRADPLKHFIVFTSAAGLVGNPGQAAYVAANTYLEGLILKRRQASLPGLAIGWGAIADTGLLTQDTELAGRLAEVTGLQPMKAQDALAWLGRLLASGEGLGPIQYYSAFKIAAIANKLAYLQTPIFSELRSHHNHADVTPSALVEQLAALDHGDAIKLIIDLCRKEIAQILKIKVDQIEESRALAAFGFDSLMGLELLMSLEKLFGQTIPTIGLADKSIVDVAHTLWEALQASKPVSETDAQIDNGTHLQKRSSELEQGGHTTPSAKSDASSAIISEHDADGTQSKPPFGVAAE